MAHPSLSPWVSNPNAPKIPPSLYFSEKATLVGALIGAVLYGITVLLFSKCMVSLCNPARRMDGRLRWGLSTYTVVMFAFATVFTAANLDFQSIANIDNREFPGINGPNYRLDPGPIGYQLFIYPTALNVNHCLTFHLSSWLADGLLLYQCYHIFGRKFKVIAFPCLMYLAALVTGLIFIYNIAQPQSGLWSAGVVSFGLPTFSLSISLNILLTLMIVWRFVQHNIGSRTGMGRSVTKNGFYQKLEALVLVFVESSALYSITSLLFIAPWGAGSNLAYIFLPVLAETQVISSFLVVDRRGSDESSSSTSSSTFRNTEPFTARSRGESMIGGDALSSRYSTSTQSSFGKIPTAFIGIETIVDIHHDQVLNDA